MDRPLLHAAVSWVARTLGRRRCFALSRLIYGLALRGGRQRAEVDRVLGRVLRFQGREPSRAELDRLVSELVWLYSDMQTTLSLLDPRRPGAVLERVELPLLGELERLRARGRGVILAGPHFGNVVLAIAALGAAGARPCAVLINAEPYRWTEAFGLRVASLGSSAVDCMGALARNETVFLLTDLEFFPGGRTASFFGAPVRPPDGAARLALACGAPLLPVYAVHLGAGRYRLECDAAIEPRPGAAPEELGDALLRSMERRIGERPGHWLVLRDIWDIERCDKLNQRHLAVVAHWRRWISLGGGGHAPAAR